MATIKKAYQPIFEVLNANLDAQVSDVIEQLTALASAKTGGGGGKATNFHKLEDGTVAGIKCYYHGLWMDPRVVEFGNKTSSPTGLNNMCKDGVNKWTKQDRATKNLQQEILAEVMSGDIAPEDIATVQEEREAAIKAVIPREDGYGFATLEEMLADSEERGLAVA